MESMLPWYSDIISISSLNNTPYILPTLKEKAETMLQHSETITVTSINKDGYPRPVYMSKIYSEGFSTVWLATGKDSVKVRDFSANPKAGICFQENGNSVALTGNIKIITNIGIKKEMWQDWFIEHFPMGPDDPNYILLKFEGNHATFWIDGKFIHRKI